MIPALEEATGEKFPPADQLHTTETNEFLKKVLQKMNVQCSEPRTNARMIDKLVGEYIEETAINPTFIVGTYLLSQCLSIAIANNLQVTRKSCLHWPSTTVTPLVSASVSRPSSARKRYGAFNLSRYVFC
jgi:hypothetical protein